MKTHYVYRCFDETGRLIYVGRSATPHTRLEFHRRNSWWAPQAVRVKIAVFPNKEQASAAERDAIASENPRWNTLGKWANNATWSEQDYLDYVKAYTNSNGINTAYGRRHMRNLWNLYTQRFGTASGAAA